MTQDEQDVLAEAAKIVNEASERVTSDRAEGVETEFKKLEQAMWTELGEPEGLHSLFTINQVPSDEVDGVLDHVSKHPERLVQGEDTIEGSKPDVLIGFSKVAEGGDIYEMLEHKLLSLSVAREESVIGVLARMDAKATNSETSEKADACITLMLLADNCYVAVRQYEKPDEPVFYTKIHADEYEQGVNKVIDAMLLFFAVPKAMFQQKPAVMEALYKDLSAQAEGNK